MWAEEKVNPNNNKTTPAGDWANLNYRLFCLFLEFGTIVHCYIFRFRTCFPTPIPHKIRDQISDEEVRKFLARDFIAKAPDGKKLEVAVKYALSYRGVFDTVVDAATQAHTDAVALEDALLEIK